MTTAEKIERMRGELDSQEAALARMRQAGGQRTSAYRSGKQRAEWLRGRIRLLQNVKTLRAWVPDEDEAGAQ